MNAPAIARVLDGPLSSYPTATAVVARSGALTFSELDAAASAAAGGLWSLGVRPGDRVAACLPNDLDEALTEFEQRTVAELVQPSVLIAGPRCMLDDPYVIGAGAWAGLNADGHAAPPVLVDPHAPAGVAVSSGTTGAPKATVHSQRTLALPAAVLAPTRGWGPDLRKGDSLPLTVLNMLVLSTLVTAQAGGCTVVMDRRDPDGVAEWIQGHQVTVWNGASAQLFDLARRPDLALTSLTEVWTGGGICPEHVRDSFRAAHGLPVTATYGLSEAPTVVAIDPVGGGHRDAASGQVLPHLSVRAYDDKGQLLPHDRTGELAIGPATAGPWAGWWQPPLGRWEDRAARKLESDVVMTGDVGWVDSEGWLTMVDRKKLMIVRGGANVSPAEVEGVLLEHPLVMAAAVFALPDQLGERVATLLVCAEPPPDAGELTSFCGGRLARYKVPEVWARLPSLPVNAMGKIIRTGLVARLESATPL